MLLCIVQYNAQTIADSLILESIKAPKKYRLAPISVTGATATDPQIIVLLSGLVAGEEVSIPGDKITDALKKLWKQGLFDDIEINLDKVVGDDAFLVIKVIEKPKLTKFRFSGDVRKGEADDLRGKLRLFPEKPVTEFLKGNIKNTVRDYFLDKGFLP
jgi:outer membrane protein insertion porin family